MAFLKRFKARESLRAEAVEPSRRGFLAMGCACCLAAALPVSPAVAQSAAVQSHLAAARQAAGTDLGRFMTLGEVAAPTPGRPATNYDLLISQPPPPPGKAFDNLYFIGGGWVSAWAITTSEGIILVDAMNNDVDAERAIIAGMRTLGLDPAQIKTIIVTHGHGDHYGGANYLIERYHPRIVMSAEDWTMMETKLEFDRPDWGRPPRRDISAKDGDKVTLGDTTVDLVVTGGHTMGTLSLLFDAKQGGQTHRAVLWGGTSFNFGRQPDRIERLQAYIDATARIRRMVAEQGVDIFLSNHSAYDQVVANLAAMPRLTANPFVLGTETVQRALTVMHECAQATMAAWTA